MSRCCCSSYQSTFNCQRAETELADYRNGNLKKMTRPLVEALQRRNLEGLTLLDIGGGVGAIIFELMTAGVRQAVNVDISQAYLEVFRKEAERRGLSTHIQALPGDFIDLAPELEPNDIVTLDKVICCYPDYESLVRLSLRKCRKYYAYIIPRDLWWVRLFDFLEQPLHWLRGETTSTFIHPVAEIERLVQEAGFQKIEQTHRREWLIAVFEKQAATKLNY